MGGEEESGGGWQRGWVRISLQSQLARRWGNAAPGASFPARAASVQPSAAGMRWDTLETVPKWSCREARPYHKGIALSLSLEEHKKEMLVTCCWLMA